MKSPHEFAIVENGRWPKVVLVNASSHMVMDVLDHSLLRTSTSTSIVIIIHFFMASIHTNCTCHHHYCELFHLLMLLFCVLILQNNHERNNNSNNCCEKYWKRQNRSTISQQSNELKWKQQKSKGTTMITVEGDE